jgi:hypothetical protein
MLTVERLKELLHYDPDTGHFTWLADFRHQHKSGDRAGTLCHGYRRIKIDRVLYYEHRLAWLYMCGEFPPKHIDHADMDRANNRWSNLRLATRSQNQANRPTTNKIGLKGVKKISDGRYEARIQFGTTRIFLGTFSTPEAANAAYYAAAREAYGDFARAA